MSKYAIINNGKVENVAIAGGPLASNWVPLLGIFPEPGIGWSYVNAIFAAPPIIPPIADPALGLIDIGPFLDRFDNFVPGTKLALLSHSNATVQGIIKDVLARKWITLSRPNVAAAIDILIALAIPNVTIALKNYIINTPVSTEENWALKKMYFS